MCTDLEQRSTPYNYVQQSMVQGLHKCNEIWGKVRRIQNFLSGPGGDREKSFCMSNTKRHVPLFQTHSET